ncbi:sulfotransferase domain-containing protein [Paenibacillus tarimensis]|uniref:sulfotransferase domain-containing protein n=1 Tax=Paenibacillus tarimensis TaxID=416012 RepID=UPI001F3C81E0|nr:sulfotransferase domain-containing protein [Paenibacillus tarimensis]MCF2944910.1 sulfotransferase domain-containing protein [Paenibacillus tarimensis]
MSNQDRLAPRIFANTFPKSGTGLLEQLLWGLPYEKTIRRVIESEEKLEERGIAPGEIVFRHTVHTEEHYALDTRNERLLTYLKENQVKTFFLYRDLRDVCVSNVFYITDIAGPAHPLYTYFTEHLHTFEQRLTAVITGVEGIDLGMPDHFRRFAGWLEEPDVCTLAYEDLVGPDRRMHVERMVRYLWESIAHFGRDQEAVALSMLGSVEPGKPQTTFRVGKAGRWRNYFTEEHIRLFKAEAGDLLIRLGYELSNDWN